MTLVPKVLDIVYWPNESLHKPCNQVTNFNTPELEQLVVDMIATMDANNAIGLAAPQVGKNISMFIVRIEPQNTMVFFNPYLTIVDDTPYT